MVLGGKCKKSEGSATDSKRVRMHVIKIQL